MANEDVVVPAAEAPEAPEAPEIETPEEPEAPEPEADEPQEDLVQIRKDAKAFQDQKRRAEKAEARVRELEGKPKPADPEKGGEALSNLTKRVVRAELAGLGIKDQAEQDFVIAAATRLGIEPSAAATDEIVAAKLEKMREAKATKEATPPPNKGGRNAKPQKNAWDMTDEEFQRERSRVMSGRA
ncbi:MAG: hypothetical protein KF889_01610 [Alphaproteobacteria bacterium]|nr:hypothetical protein [Alphaproteobacteria bacterium]MCW5741603.1 hypothetical protein [Alphaproteobacteria bacterium]